MTETGAAVTPRLSAREAEFSAPPFAPLFASLPHMSISERLELAMETLFICVGRLAFAFLATFSFGYGGFAGWAFCAIACMPEAARKDHAFLFVFLIPLFIYAIFIRIAAASDERLSLNHTRILVSLQVGMGLGMLAGVIYGLGVRFSQ